MTTKMQILGSTLLTFGLLCSGCKEEPPEIDDMKWGPIPGKPSEAYHVTVMAKPEIQERKDYSLLLLPAVNGRPIEIVCGQEFSPWFSDLPKNKPLTFTVWQTKRVDWHTSAGKEKFSWQSEIETIKDGAGLIYDAAVCPLHKVRMKRADIEISYGLPMREFLEASKEFSGGPGFTLGGCVVSNTSPKTERGYKCDECVAAYERWEERWKQEMKARARLPKVEAQEAKTAN